MRNRTYTPNSRIVKVPFTFEVTQEDLDEGMICNGYLCPVARALRRQLNITSVEVAPTIIEMYGRIEGRPEKAWYIVEGSLKTYIYNVDLENKPEPRSFTIPVPEAWVPNA